LRTEREMMRSGSTGWQVVRFIEGFHTTFMPDYNGRKRGDEEEEEEEEETGVGGMEGGREKDEEEEVEEEYNSEEATGVARSVTRIVSHGQTMLNHLPQILTYTHENITRWE